MFERYLLDAKDLLDEAKSHEKGNEIVSRRLYRSVVWHLSAAVEAYLNSAAAALDRTRIDPILIAYLQDKAFVVKTNTATLVHRTEFHSVEDRFKLLARLYGCTIQYQSSEWNGFISLKDLRDALTHPKVEEDLTPLTKYYRVCHTGLSSVLFLLGELNKSFYE